MLEFIIAILLMAIMLLSSVVGYRSFVEKNQLSSIVNTLVGALQFARLEAMASHHTIIVCARGEYNRCGLNWRQGQIILDKKNKVILRYVSALPDGYQLYWKSTLGETDALQFLANGFTHGQQGSFLICHKGESARIIILRTGRLRSEIGDIVGC